MATAKVMIYNYDTADNDGDVKRNGKNSEFSVHQQNLAYKEWCIDL